MSSVPPVTDANHHVANGVTAASAPGGAGRNLQDELAAIFGRPQEPKVAIGQLAKAVERHTRAEWVVCFQLTADQKLVPVATQGRQPRDSDVSPTVFVAACLRATKTNTVVSECVCAATQRHVLVVQVPSVAEPTSVLAILLAAGPDQLASAAATLGQSANALSQWRLLMRVRSLEWEAQASACAAELVSRIETSASAQAACLLVANELKSFLTCEQVAVGLAREGRAGVRLQAISEMSQFDASAPSIRAVSAVLDEVAIRGELTTWPPRDADDRHAALAIRKLAEESQHTVITCSPLTSIDGEFVGAILLAGRHAVLRQDTRVQFVEAICPHIATALQARQSADMGPLRRLRQVMTGQSSARRRWMALGAAVILVLPFIPWRYHVTVDCKVEPIVRRFMVAPYEGILEAGHVRPGELVEAGAVVASMDDRELRWELSSVAAERVREAKKRDAAMDAHDTSEAQMAELEMRRLDLKIKLLRHRQENLEIATPIAGVVLKGELEDAEGAPVKTGQALYEIAPLSPVKLELAIPEDDLPSVTPGMSLRVRLEGYAGQPVAGTIKTIHPRSEIRDADNVFIAEVELPNKDQSLKPGMSGRARIKSHIHSLGWIWFHKAWHRLRMLFG